MRQAAHANEPSRLKPVRGRVIAAKSSLLENIAIAAGSEAKQLGTLAGELLQLGEGAGNIFELRQAELAAATDEEVVLENSRRFSAALAAEVARLVGLTGDELNDGTAASNAAIAGSTAWG